ncbi:hypothetical protein O3M35_005405 [Rhynocoris fuscipes]|uniref:DNA-3-methyladenine glycosylase n=1 Tax=Rhynocoris fuscipes TaxID=488301 RepID=A0AAW1DKC7_9HEMI
MLDMSLAGKRLSFSDYDVPCVILAKRLLGLHLCRRLDSGEEVKGMIVETESYLGGDDKASHSFAGKRTERNSAMYMKPGTAYVYSTYGMYFCLNVSSKGEGAAVLIRALEPICGVETMLENRMKNQRKKVNDKKTIKLVDLSNGPSKLCMSFDINKTLNKVDMVKSEKLWLERPMNDILDNDNNKIIACSRIGIEYAGKEWSSKPLRFYIRGNQCVSKRDKKAELSFISE